MKLRTLFIGAGGISHCHAKALLEIGVEIAGVYDVSQPNAERFAQLYHTKIVTDIDQALKDVDMVHLLTPPSKRVTYALSAIHAGKHIFIEKPISITIEDAELMVEEAAKYHVKMVVGFNHRYRKGYQMLFDAVASGQLGAPVNVFSHRLGSGAGFRGQSLAASWRTDPKLVCGMSIESLSHDVDMLLPLVHKVQSVNAVTFGTIQDIPDFDNNSNVIFSLLEGGIGTIHASWSSDIPYSARGYIGTDGTALIRGNGLWDFDEFIIKTKDMPEMRVVHVGEDFASTAHQSYVNIQKHFVECIEKDLHPLTDGQSGIDTLIFNRAILEAAKTSNKVDIWDREDRKNE